jgi:putative sterol carrier protein
VQEAYEVLSNLQERAYYDDNREQVLMSDGEDEDETQTAEVEAELDFYRWASREAFVDFSHGATQPTAAHAHAKRHPPLTPEDISRSGGRLLLGLLRRLPQAA